jgi:pimeloyl-ACP methyl ester carboxylesterase
MKRFILVALYISAQTAHAQIKGTWSGKLGGSLTVLFHFTPAGDAIEGTLDVPQQGATGLALSEVRLTPDSLVCRMNAPLASYEALKTSDSTYEGSWIQGKARIALGIHRLSGAEAAAFAPPARPQTPKPPFPYKSDSVEYDNADRTVHLAGTLTYPSTGGRFPVAVLITGSGIQDRDETIFSHHPFAVIADYLTRRGYAVLRVDDRTAGLSRGDVIHATSADFARDVETSLAWLKRQKHIDTTRMGLIGHSEGAMIAPMVAARNPSVAFIILLAAPAEGGFATMGYQTLRPLENAKAPNIVMKAAMMREKILLTHMQKDTTPTEFVEGVDAQYRKYTETLRDSTGKLPPFVVPPDQLKDALVNQAPVLIQPWWKFFLGYDPAEDYRKLHCYVLALGGDKDIQVDNAIDLRLILNYVSPDERPKLTEELLPGLNHLFQHCTTCSVEEYGKLEETFSPGVLKIMGDWLDKRFKPIP